MTNQSTLSAFFRVFSKDHNVDKLMNKVFCADRPDRKIPAVGVTDHGPQYKGAADVAELFHQLFKTFPDVKLTPVRGAPRLHSADKKTIGVLATLTGTHHEEWFPHGHRFFSPPLSGIHPGKARMEIPASAIFTFDRNHRITRFAIYMDRYRMQQQLTGSAPARRK